MLRNSCARLPNREKVNGYAPEKMAFSLHRWLVNGYAPEKSGILSDYIHFYVLLGTNGYQKEALLALSAADCSPGILNGYAPEYVGFRDTKLYCTYNDITMTIMMRGEGTFTMQDWDDITNELKRFWWPSDMTVE